GVTPYRCVNAVAAQVTRVIANLAAGYFYVVISGSANTDAGKYDLAILGISSCAPSTPTPIVTPPTSTPISTATSTRTPVATQTCPPSMLRIGPGHPGRPAIIKART